jgi:Fe-S-cluster containining protein
MSEDRGQPALHPESSFSCRRCGACCRWPGHVLLSDRDIVQLAGHLRLSENDFVARHALLASNRAQLSLREKSDGSCEFLNGNLCTVYEVRPEQCRTFPASWRISMTACPASKP